MKLFLKLFLLLLIIANIVLAHDVLIKKPKRAKLEPKTFYVVFVLFESRKKANELKRKINSSGNGYAVVHEMEEEEINKYSNLFNACLDE